MEITVAGGGIMAQTADTYVVEVFADGRLASEAAARARATLSRDPGQGPRRIFAPSDTSARMENGARIFKAPPLPTRGLPA